MAEVITLEELNDLLDNWEYLFTYGKSLDVYGFGNLRLAIDRETGEKVLSYVANK